MDAAHIKWFSVVGIAIVAALLAWYDHRQSGRRADIEKEIAGKEKARAQRETKQRDVIRHLAAMADARKALERSIGLPGEREAMDKLVLAIAQVPPEMRGEVVGRADMDAVDLLNLHKDKQDRVGMFIDVETVKNAGDVDRLKSLRDGLAEAVAAGRWRFALLQVLTLIAVAVSAFPIGGD